MARTTFTTPEGQATRARIVEASIRAFAARGFRGVSIDAVAAEVGVSRQGVLHHFSSKVDLLIAVLEQHERDNALELAELFAANDRVLEATMRAYVRTHVKSRGLIRILLVLAAEAIDPEHPAHDYFVERYRYVRAGIARWIAGEQAAGRLITALPPERLAAVVVAVLDGLQLQAYLDDSAIELEQTLADLLELFSVS